jgi:hypothetical protein
MVVKMIQRRLPIGQVSSATSIPRCSHLIGWIDTILSAKNDAEIAHEGELSSALIAAYEVTTFETKWIALQVLKNQLSITSKDALSDA